MNEFTQFLSDCWRMFEEVQVPILNISFAKFWLGIFVVGISISILRPLLGIGANAANDATNIFRGAAKRGYDRSYAKYRKNRERQESFAKRYKESHKT